MTVQNQCFSLRKLWDTKQFEARDVMVQNQWVLLRMNQFGAGGANVQNQLFSIENEAESEVPLPRMNDALLRTKQLRAGGLN